MRTLILIPAAGAARRMEGRDKLMLEIDGTPMLVRQTRTALATGAEVLVTLPPDRPARISALAALASPALQTRIIPEARAGMSGSLRHGAEVARASGRDLLVLLPDMPDIEAADIERILAAKRPDTPILRGATEAGVPGHPVLFDARLLPEFATLVGDVGAAPVIKAHQGAVTLVPLKGQRACRDIDTPADWAAYSGISTP
ncbi:nucleotidyltransferase family protein [Roseisalinus antarcticus]|uniref:Molybdopterin-guanine dinucleotide biosynthesis protein MobA n=1 Tax=Roseisalinus antarcticus TaxID=254357 RepID=A0A1Y5TBQ3_9RHOB|nr:nucleotidyltransferase family protein [Roseisalinus antarcticus]SLN60152.1 molybdopterin-guanine dinucleotide biosynthesis protein MobA [Roseisalinus antarcticus]